jgi:hypothetical protein
VLRLHDLPEEYTSPLKYGDVTIVWSPLRDTASISFAARQTTSSVVVKGVQAWYGAAATPHTTSHAACIARTVTAAERIAAERIFARHVRTAARVSPRRVRTAARTAVRRVCTRPVLQV